MVSISYDLVIYCHICAQEETAFGKSYTKTGIMLCMCRASKWWCYYKVNSHWLGAYTKWKTALQEMCTQFPLALFVSICQDHFTGTGSNVWFPQWQKSYPGKYEKYVRWNHQEWAIQPQQNKIKHWEYFMGHNSYGMLSTNKKWARTEFHRVDHNSQKVT